MIEYAVDNRIFEEPAFTWWSKHLLNKIDRIISKTQRYCVKTNKYVLRVPKTLKKDVNIDK